MAKKASAKTIRTGGKRYRIYNEGLCVYLHDVGTTERLRKLINSQGDPDETLYDNLAHPKISKAVLKDALVLAYELGQDDDVSVEVIIGKPLTDKELAVARWFPPQHAKLSLPTGRLRIDTSDTLPLDSAQPEEKGAVIAVPAGDYALILHRIDEDACRREKIKFKGIGEVLVLTPLKSAPSVPKHSPILEYPEPEEDTSWIGQYSLQGKKFDCLVNFWDHWEVLRLNFDSKAVKSLGLKCGSVLKLKAAGTTFDLIYLDDWKREDYLTRFGSNALNADFKGSKELALGNWQDFDGYKVLSFYRIKATKSVPEKYHEVWPLASGEVTSKICAPPAAVKASQAVIKAGKITATVLVANNDLVILNVTADQVKNFGRAFKLVLPHGTHTIAYEPNPDMQIVFLTGGAFPGGLHYANKTILRLLARERKIPKKSSGFTIETVPAKEREPVKGAFLPPTKDPLSKYLHITRMYVDSQSKPFDWPAPPAVGSQVELRKS